MDFVKLQVYFQSCRHSLSLRLNSSSLLKDLSCLWSWNSRFHKRCYRLVADHYLRKSDDRTETNQYTDIPQTTQMTTLNEC